MAITLVDQVAATITAGGGDQTVNLNITTAANDVIHAATFNSTDSFPATPTGFTQISTVYFNEHEIYRKVSAGGETSVAIPKDGTNSLAYIIAVWRGVDAATPEDAAATTANNGGAAPDSPPITTVTDNAVVVSYGAAFQGGGITAAPSGYGDFLVATDGGNGHVGMGWKTVASAGAENPGAFTSGVPTLGLSTSVAIRPAAVAATGAKNMLLLGVG